MAIKEFVSSDSVTIVLRVGMGSLLIVSGVLKLLSPVTFYAALRGADFLPEAASNLLASTIPVIEIGLGVGLLIGLAVRAMAVCSLILLSMFTGFLLLETARGHQVDCGCFGEMRGLMRLMGTGISPLLRNAILLIAAGRLVRGAGSRNRFAVDRVLFSKDKRSRDLMKIVPQHERGLE